ncbi:MAG: YfiR family protein [Armatimonadota bacterium]|nr:YfiR family protein [bacterium]
MKGRTILVLRPQSIKYGSGQGIAILLFVVSACLGMSGPAFADSAKGGPSEYELKSAYIFNFVKFVEWPDGSFSDANSPIVIGILGDDPFGNTIDNAVANKTVNGRKLHIHRFKKASDLKQVHVLYISASEDKHLMDTFNVLKDKPVLTIGETGSYARSGGIIRFLNEDNKIRFSIYADKAKKVGLKISSKLLKLAKTVKA